MFAIITCSSFNHNSNEYLIALQAAWPLVENAISFQFLHIGGGTEKIGKRGTQKQSSEEDGFASWEIWPCSYPKNCTHSTLRKTSFSRGDKIYGINSLVSERPESYEWKNWIFSIKRKRKVQMQILQLKSVFHKFTQQGGWQTIFCVNPSY